MGIAVLVLVLMVMLCVLAWDLPHAAREAGRHGHRAVPDAAGGPSGHATGTARHGGHPMSMHDPVAGPARARGTAQLLHVEEVGDAMVIDAFVVVHGATPAGPSVLGPTTFVLREPGQHTIDATTRHHVRHWCDDTTILGVEILRNDSTVSIAVEDGSSRMQFDIPTAG